jgi:hypothetical protein
LGAGQARIAAAIGLIEVTDLRRIYRIQQWEFWLSIACFIGVAVLGVIPGIGLAIVIAIATTGTLQTSEEVDLLALAAEECARYDCELKGEPVTVRGDPRLLCRMIRNLLETPSAMVRRRYGLTELWRSAAGGQRPRGRSATCGVLKSRRALMSREAR